MSEIPKISNRTLKELYKQMKPVVRFGLFGKKLEPDDRGELYYIKDPDLRGEAFTWDPEATKKATGLKKLEDIVTYHSYGYYGFFKPSIAEVVAQIPKKYLSKVAAFETSTDASIDGDYHATTTTLYEKYR